MCLPGGVRSWHGKGGYNDQRKIEYHAPFLHTKIRNGYRRNTQPNVDFPDVVVYNEDG